MVVVVVGGEVGWSGEVGLFWRGLGAADPAPASVHPCTGPTAATPPAAFTRSSCAPPPPTPPPTPTHPRCMQCVSLGHIAETDSDAVARPKLEAKKAEAGVRAARPVNAMRLAFVYMPCLQRWARAGLGQGSRGLPACAAAQPRVGAHPPNEAMPPSCPPPPPPSSHRRLPLRGTIVLVPQHPALGFTVAVGRHPCPASAEA